MELSPEEKQRIYREEKARLEAQTRLRQRQENQNALGGCLVVIVCLGLLGGAISFLGGGCQSSPQTVAAANSMDRKITALVMSQEFVKERLKAPATADFPLIDNPEVSVIEQSGNRYLVTSYVDSENSFGAKIRTRYSCTLKDLGNEQWRAISTHLDE